MRGKQFHNLIASRARTILQGFFSCIYMEYRFRKNDAVTDFDIFVKERSFALGIEVETTRRHGIDNARRAAVVGVPLWVIAPTKKVKNEITRKLKPLQLRPGGEPIKILLLGQLQSELEAYSRLKTKHKKNDIVTLKNSKGEN